MKVSWDYEIPNIWKNEEKKQTTNQLSCVKDLHGEKPQD